MTQPKHAFWQDPEMVSYFAEKPADPLIVERLGIYTAASEPAALDLGCGGGRHSEMLANMGYSVTAVDHNPEMINYTSSRLEQAGYSIQVAEMAIEELNLPEAAYDVVVCTGVLHQVCSVDDYREALRKISRVLKPGGLFTMNVFTNSTWDDSYTLPDPSEPFTVKTREGLFQTLLSAENIIQFAEQADLMLDQIAAHDHRIENTGPRSVFRAHFLKSM